MESVGAPRSGDVPSSTPSPSIRRADWPMALGLHRRAGQSTPKGPLRPDVKLQERAVVRLALPSLQLAFPAIVWVVTTRMHSTRDGR